MSRRRILSDDERRLWRLAMRDADPLPGRTVEWEEPPPPPLPAPLVAEAPVPAGSPGRPAAVPARRTAPRGAAMAPLEPGVHHNVDRRTSDRLRRGRLDIDGRIDLHGMSQAQAHTALAAFVHRAWHEGRRCVLVITGKGSFSPEGGVLRRMVPRWLADAPLRPMVVAVQHAQPRDGGDGALYVLIKRRRDRDEHRFQTRE